MQTEIEFQKTVLAGVETITGEVKTIQTNQDKLLADYSRLDAQTKTAFEDLTKVKNHANDVATVLVGINKVIANLQRESRQAFGDPIQRILSNPDRREYWNAIARAIMFPGSPLPEVLTKAFTGVASPGSLTIPTEIASEFFDVLYQYGAWPSLGQYPVGARTNTYPILTARPNYYWVGAGVSAPSTPESSAITEGSFTGTSVNLTIETMGVLVHVTEELIEDSTVDISGLVMRNMAQSVSQGLDFTFFNGAAGGTRTDSGYRGVFNMGATNANMIATAASGNTTMAGLELDDWLRCLTTVTGGTLQRPCRWWMHPRVLASTCLIRDQNGRPLFQTATDAPLGGIGSILGYPVTTVASAPDTAVSSSATPNAKVAAFGDPQGYAVGIRRGVDLQSTNLLKFVENMRSFRALTRAGGVCLQSGATVVPLSILTMPAI